jgi:5-(hydroxymethyl)furfural/furfural oxidase
VIGAPSDCVSDLFARPAAHRVRFGNPLAPGDSGPPPDDDAALDRWMLANCYDSQHAAGSCRMGGASDPRSVVDPECRVIGLEGLRVIDCSIMPEIVRANTHLSTVMIAERMADRLSIQGPAPH